MIVEIVRDRDSTNILKGKKVERIEFDGDTIFPFYINCLSIQNIEGGLRIFILDDYKIKKTFGKKDNLWIIGDSTSDRATINRITTDDTISERESKYKSLSLMGNR